MEPEFKKKEKGKKHKKKKLSIRMGYFAKSVSSIKTHFKFVLILQS
jgi:hypothetical protein